MIDSFDTLLLEVEEKGLIVDDEADLPPTIMGAYVKSKNADVILINKNIKSIIEKRMIMAEEIGHYFTTYGDISNQENTYSRKLEKIARRWAYERLVSVDLLVEAFEKGITDKFELADFLNVSERFLDYAVGYYKHKHGDYCTAGNYKVYFDPLRVTKLCEE